MIKDDFGAFRVEKRSQGGPPSGKIAEKSMISAWSDAVKIKGRFYKSCHDFDSKCQTTMLSKFISAQVSYK